MRVKTEVMLTDIAAYKDLEEAKEAAEEWAKEIAHEQGCDYKVISVEEDS